LAALNGVEIEDDRETFKFNSDKPQINSWRLDVGVSGEQTSRFPRASRQS
jgi:hypothetical protein